VGKARGALSPRGGEFLEARVGLGVSTWEAVGDAEDRASLGLKDPPVGRLPGLHAFPDLDAPATGWEGVCANVCGGGGWGAPELRRLSW